MVDDYRALAALVRKRSQTSVLRLLAAESAFSMANQIREPDTLAYLKTFPWANVHVARLALSNGTDFNRRTANDQDVIRLKEAYHALDPDSERGDVWTVMTRMLHEQLPLQTNIGHELARSYLLYGSDYPACTAFQWEDVLGMSLERRIRAVLFLWGLSLSTQGRIDQGLASAAIDSAGTFPSHLDDDVAATIADLSSTTLALRPQHMQALGARDVPDMDDENPLFRYPIVRLATGESVVPSLPHLLRTVYTDGLYYRGGHLWGDDFARALGPRLEAVTGLDLRVLSGANVFPEIVYDSGNSKSVDWIVVFPECVLLVECKSARVTLRSLRSIDSEEALLRRSLGKGAEQLNRSAKLIAERRPEFRHIPADRPVYGLIITAEVIPMANVGHGRYALRSTIPIEVIPLRDLIAFCALERPDPGQAVHTYFVNRNPVDPSFAREAYASVLPRRHPHVEAAWERIHAPFGPHAR